MGQNQPPNFVFMKYCIMVYKYILNNNVKRIMLMPRNFLSYSLILF